MYLAGALLQNLEHLNEQAQTVTVLEISNVVVKRKKSLNNLNEPGRLHKLKWPKKLQPATVEVGHAMLEQF